MIVIITIVTIILFAVLIGYTWHRLDTLEKHIKIIYILIGLMIISAITFMIFNISSIGIQYEEIGIKNDIRTMLVLVFTPLNALITMPSFAKILAKINNNDIEKNKVLLKIGLILFIFILIILIEISYLKNIQLGIIEIYHKLK